jgi:hypothetical protein
MAYHRAGRFRRRPAQPACRGLKIEARRSDLTDQQIEQWAHALADRLQAAGVVAGTDIDVQIGAA